MTSAERVRKAASRATVARAALELEICDARRAGLSLRTIAAAAGLSHERVRQIVKAGG
jgi:DNA-directed RNA polymerase sigma subunit (sigma70/sigma32)